MIFAQIGTRKVPDITKADWNFHIGWKVPHLTDELLDVYATFADVDEAVKAAKALMSKEATFAVISRREGMSTSSETVRLVEQDGTVLDFAGDPLRAMRIIHPNAPWLPA